MRALEPLRYTARFAKDVIPRVDREMDHWRHFAARIPQAALREQALASIGSKLFHAEGGSVFAAADPAVAEHLVPLIVALQTISDYLDNLGDRTDSLDERDFRSLHQSMLDAVSTEPVFHDYYAHHPHKDDGGYLLALVQTCQQHVRQLPDYHLVEREVRRHVERYCDLQVYKHLPWTEREQRLIEWHKAHPDRPSGLEWWEFSAACGSTLGMFALFLEAARGTDSSRVDLISRVYFPWVCGVHILLDYLIDLEEDRIEGDLNFVSYYPSLQDALTGMRLLVRRGVKEVKRLPNSPFHMAVLEGLLGLYLTDGKVREQRMGRFAYRLMAASTLRTWLVYAYCGMWRRKHGRR